MQETHLMPWSILTSCNICEIHISRTESCFRKQCIDLIAGGVGCVGWVGGGGGGVWGVGVGVVVVVGYPVRKPMWLCCWPLKIGPQNIKGKWNLRPKRGVVALVPQNIVVVLVDEKKYPQKIVFYPQNVKKGVGGTKRRHIHITQ